MRLAFTGEGRYAEFEKSYDEYVKRSKKGEYVDFKTYKRLVKGYCKGLARRLIEGGMVDLPCDMGSIAAATLTRKLQYRGKKVVGYGKMDWKKGHYDGKLKAFGMVYLPRRGKNANMRSYGFVANRRLFQKMKNIHESGESNWTPIEFNEGMV
jgi:hypothetical protein